MRTGAIFARGGCRALKWMALVGVVLALGAAEALAQPELSIRSVTVGGRTTNTVGEGQLLTVTVALSERVPRTQTGVNTVVVTLAEGVLDDAGEFQTTTGLGATGWAEADDVVIPNVTITIGEQASSGSASFVTGRDSDAVNERFRIRATAASGTGSDATTFTVASGTSGMFNGTIDDAEEQNYELKLDTAVTANKPVEGGGADGTFGATLRAVPARPPNETVTAYMYLSTGGVRGYAYLDSGAAVSGVHSVVLGSGVGLDGSDPGDGSQGSLVVDLSVQTPPNDRNRTDDTITLEAFTGSAGRNEGVSTLDVEVADIHKLPDADAISGEARDNEKYVDGQMVTSVMEGGTAYVFVTVENTLRDQVADDEKFSVSLSAADSGQLLDFKVTPSSITVPARDDFTLSSDDSERVGPFTLEALADEDIGAETLMLNIDLTTAEPAKGYGAGTSAGMFSIDIEDATSPLVWASEGFEEAVYAAKGEGPMHLGDSFEIMTSDLFEMADGVMVAYSATSDSAAASATASNTMVTVMGEEAGMAHITVTATATISGVEALPQTMSNIAQIKFPVSVVLADLSVSVAADSMEVMEGGSTMLTATANRAVTEDTMIALSVIGDEDAYMVADAITIESGMASGSVELMASEDDDYMDETLTVVATGPGIDGSMQLEVMVTDNDEAPEPTNLVTAKSSEEIQMVLEAAGLGDDDMFHTGGMKMVDASMLFDTAEGVSVSYAAESDDMAAASTSVSGSMVTVTAGEAGHARVTITATATMASGIEIYPGQPATNVATVLFSVNVTNTPLAVTVSTDPMDMVEEGGMITVTATANRDVVADDGDVQVTLTITGAVEMNEATIAIAAGSSNSTMVQVLDDMEVAPMADITIVATGSGIATAQTFTISVTENDSARTFTLSAPEDMMNLVEGGDGVELRVTADPAVSEDTEVMIMVDRSASTAGADDFTAAAVMISAGETSGTTMLMATEDDMPDSGHGSPEMLVVFAMADNTQSNTVSFYIWDMAVPALPLIAQLLLAAFLAIGGYRRYLRR